MIPESAGAVVVVIIIIIIIFAATTVSQSLVLEWVFHMEKEVIGFKR
jgi:hypothetical protein